MRVNRQPPSRFIGSLLGVCCIVAFAAAPGALAAEPQPPPMPQRAIAPPATQPAGEQINLVDGDVKFLLYIPPDYHVPADGRVNLTVHFHTVVWFVIDEHRRRGITEPLAIFTLGEGSSTYRKPFEDEDRFARILGLIENTLAHRMGPARVSVEQIDITSFSAGYGAVREIVKQERYWKKIRRIILADSLYASWDPATTQPGATSRPASENIEPWRAYVESAARGERTFVLTHSMVPTSYANTYACAKSLIEMVGAPVREIRLNEIPAASDPDFPLLYRADKGKFHIWGYGGENAQAHMTHARHLADVWLALDAAGE